MIRLYLAGGILAALLASLGATYVQTQRLHSAQDALGLATGRLATCTLTRALERTARNATDSDLTDGLSRP